MSNFRNGRENCALALIERGQSQARRAFPNTLITTDQRSDIMQLSPARRELAIDDIHELTDSDLAAVSGGALNAAMAGALAGAAKGAGPRDDGVLPTLPCDFC